ncbi:hypothetical protein VZT92_003010 [Zoarces viviparus]|uniref:Uncharacterized protein n=1 Tax=Zoarces viviparus TaxID=48416 RepID=A0AAW1G171_ZOAVI
MDEVLQQVEVHILRIERHAHIPHPVSVCRLRLRAYVPGTLLAEDALRSVLNVGLHHSCRLHRGGRNPIPVRRIRRAACEEEKGTALLL